MEGSGTVVRLPTDQTILNDERYKKRGIQIGANVLVVSHEIKIASFLRLRLITYPQRMKGTFAEYVSVPWHNVARLPASISLKIAAAGALQGLTALTFITEAHNVQAGETILVHTVAGGLGLIFAQLAKARGATVIGTTSTEAKAELARAHGADHVILYTKEDTVKRVLELTNGEGVHAVFDGVGKDTYVSTLNAYHI